MSMVWKTKEGKEIPVASMTDQHLINAWKFFSRKKKKLEAAIESNWSAACYFDSSSIAGYYAMGDAMQFDQQNEAKRKQYQERLDWLSQN